MLDGHIQEWLNLFFRWFHVVAGVAWIGTSFYFNFLEDRLRPPEEDVPGVGGELWAVHGGGFYRVTKYSVAPDRLPGTLHWFKYEAYFTWLTGASLLAIVYYLGSSGLLVDPDTDVQEGAAIFLGVSTLVLGWLVYDLACRTRLIEHPGYMATAGIAVITGVAYLLTRVMAPEAAYIHVGAMIGTWMASNVFRVIIPSQKRMVAAMERGEEPDAADGRHAGIRSRHNNYLTLPVLFIMVSNHFPSTWSHSWNWAILGGLAVGGAAVRHFFNLRGQGRRNVWILPTAVVGLLALAFVTSPNPPRLDRDVTAEPITAAEVEAIVQIRCSVCHAANPAQPGFNAPPKGITLETITEIAARADDINRVTVLSDFMPLGNITGITDQERAVIGRWIADGADASAG